MTRLATSDVEQIASELPAYDRQLRAKIGCSLKTLALRTAQGQNRIEDLQFEGIRAAVVSVTTGAGVINGFAPAVAAILSHLGFNASVPSQTDVAGFGAACADGAHMVLMADDQSFSAINLVTRRVADNSVATGRGYAVALDLMAGGLAGKPVLILGCGPVGCSAARQVAALGGRVGLLDTEAPKARRLADDLTNGRLGPVVVETSRDRAMAKYDLVLDATPVAGVVTQAHVTPRTMMAAPGVPCGLDRAAMATMTARLIHDPLQIGVAVMAAEACLPLDEETK